MDAYNNREFQFPRFATRGKAYVYVLPRRGEDLVKLGFSRDPFERFRTLHPGFYRYFDLQRGLLVELDTVKEARRIERLLIERWPDHRTSAPLEVSPQAGGHTEWFRGIGDDVVPFAQRVADRYGYAIHAPLRHWLHGRMLDYADGLFDWAQRHFDVIEWQDCNLPMHSHDPRYALALEATLAAFEAVGVDVSGRVPMAVQDWYRNRDGR